MVATSPVHSPVHGPVQSPESRFCSIPFVSCCVLDYVCVWNAIGLPELSVCVCVCVCVCVNRCVHRYVCVNAYMCSKVLHIPLYHLGISGKNCGSVIMTQNSSNI